ncbi:pyridoxamine 5'-phosphate oxidase family protein [Streptomyces sp. t39]|uniref:pyridoxamine 5'-phosphate oxidase family protein n=1 Tax=Streptomyces sp. t39 TaxID=1828156 RepID=UPI0011CE873D|nr:pyridoxamine 5'-phosphate oxidase family protein [Streptomyces sp. t39]TXS48137.1 pyridoxamine 5'-phosphate oxidase family protein [Streptomyces sp. t39]
MTTDAPRTLDERLKDTRRRFETDVDVWVATADADGGPYLVPLSFRWDGETFLISTHRTNPTARNLLASGRVRLAFGATRDVVLVHGTAAVLEAEDLAPGEADAFAAHTGFDPRAARPPYPYFRVTPVDIQAWREVNEMRGRDLMTDGRWHG